MLRIGQGGSCPFLLLLPFLLLVLHPIKSFSQDDSFPHQQGTACTVNGGGPSFYGETYTDAYKPACEAAGGVHSPTGFLNNSCTSNQFFCLTTNICVYENGVVGTAFGAPFCLESNNPEPDPDPEPEPTNDCPTDAYGDLGNICTVSNFISLQYTPITSFSALNPNNPDQNSEDPKTCVVSRQSGTDTWTYTGASADDTGLTANAEQCPEETPEPEDPVVDSETPDVPPPDSEAPDDPTADTDPPAVGGLDDPNYPNDPNEPNEPNQPEAHAPTADIPPDDEGFDISVSSDCNVAPICNGDASQCAGVYQIYESNCGSDAKNKANTEDIIDAIVDRTDRSEDEQAASELLKDVNQQLDRVQKAFDESLSDLEKKRSDNINAIDSLGTSDGDTIDGTELEEPDWLDGVLPTGGSCQKLNYSVATYSGQFPTDDGCEKLSTFRLIVGWLLYLYLIHAAIRIFKNIRAD